MKFTIYVQDNCDYCKELVIPEEIDVEYVYINRDDFSGFKPQNVPCIQQDALNFEGPQGINSILKIVKDAQDGKFKK